MHFTDNLKALKCRLYPPRTIRRILQMIRIVSWSFYLGIKESLFIKVPDLIKGTIVIFKRFWLPFGHLDQPPKIAISRQQFFNFFFMYFLKGPENLTAP